MGEPEKTPKKDSSLEILEIKDAQLIFDWVWESLEQEFGRDNLRFPKEVILLGGAPGSGKGTNTRFIMSARGFTCPPIVVSDLLNSPEAKAIKDGGGMVGDREVIGILFRKMLEIEFRDGAILDGFPRTFVQVECLKLLVQKLFHLNREFKDSLLAMHFRRPIVHVMVLFVEEKTSIDRQLKRGRDIQEHNAKIEDTGVGEMYDIRPTDIDPLAARRRYRIFKEQTWDALQSLKEVYHYHFINAEGSVREVEANILAELRYQSSLELEQKTFEALRRLPLASEITRHARQDLVRRLDGYEIEHRSLFERVVALVHEKFMPIVIRHAISGLAVVNTEDPILDDPLALSMLIDIFSERGYYAVVDKNQDKIPVNVDLKTGEIQFRSKSVYRIRIQFPGSEIRRG